MSNKIKQTSNHKIDFFWEPNEDTGFFPRNVPTTPTELAVSQYASHRALGLITPKLGKMTDKEIEDFVFSLPNEPDINPCDTTPELCEAIIRAYVNIAAHLIHRPFFASRKELPPSVARPLWDFSEYVGRPPSLTYASYALANFTTPITNRMSPSDFQIAQTPSGTADENWFVAVHLSAETAGGEVVAAIESIDKALEEHDIAMLVNAIESIESSMVFADTIMPTIAERMNPRVFLDVIRPLLYGHDRIIFRGVPNEPKVTYVGETGAQSGMMRAADVVLGTHHTEKIISSMQHFLVCAPPSHKRFFERSASIGQRLITTINDPLVQKARRSALLSMAQFRRTHLNVVIDYLIADGKKLTEKGTGGTDFTNWLQQIIDETESDATI